MEQVDAFVKHAAVHDDIGRISGHEHVLTVRAEGCHPYNGLKYAGTDIHHGGILLVKPSWRRIQGNAVIFITLWLENDRICW
jgi:hypothetical protein